MHLRDIIEDTEPKWRQILGQLRKRPDADQIIIFGSVARGEARPFSDVDCFFEAGRPEGIMALAHRYYGILDPFYEHGNRLATRNDAATGWMAAKNAASLRAAIRRDGVRLTDLVDLNETEFPHHSS